MSSAIRGPLLDHLDEIEKKCQSGNISLRDIFNIFGADGHYVLLTFLLLPFLQPIPLPGLSTPFGVLIAMVGVLAYFRKPPWIPRKWAEKKLPSTTVLRIAEGSEKVFEKLTKIFHPRYKFLFQDPFRTLSSILLVLNALLLALPLPIPFSNTIPAWTIALHALAYLEDDGLFVIFSYIGSAVCLVYFFTLAKGVQTGLGWLGF